MKTLIYFSLGLMAAGLLAGCGGGSSSNNNNPYPYGAYGNSCMPTNVAINQSTCQQYGYGWNGSTCVTPQGQVISPGTCNGGFNNFGPGYNGYNGWGPNYNGGFVTTSYYYNTTPTPYGAPYYIPSMGPMVYYYHQQRN